MRLSSIRQTGRSGESPPRVRPVSEVTLYYTARTDLDWVTIVLMDSNQGSGPGCLGGQRAVVEGDTAAAAAAVTGPPPPFAKRLTTPADTIRCATFA
jgi:hypothetical protein